MRIHNFIVNALQTNCFVVDDAGEAMIIDPGGDAESIARYLDENRLTPRFIVDTHAHFDHIAANTDLKRRYPDAVLAAHEADADALADPEKNLSVMMGVDFRSAEADRRLKEGDELHVGACALRVLHTPGHTPGGVCLYCEAPPDHDAPVLFAGDTLFAGGVGRTDFPGGDMALLIRSIREKLLVLPDETRVFTGHGPATTIARERAMNPFV